jgi:hypothetical protein
MNFRRVAPADRNEMTHSTERSSGPRREDACASTSLPSYPTCVDTISGLPAHPLLVHIPVVLLPLAALGVVGMALRSSWHRRYRWACARERKCRQRQRRAVRIDRRRLKEQLRRDGNPVASNEHTIAVREHATSRSHSLSLSLSLSRSRRTSWCRGTRAKGATAQRADTSEQGHPLRAATAAGLADYVARSRRVRRRGRVHAVGSCEGPLFVSAGSHYNPLARRTGPRRRSAEPCSESSRRWNATTDFSSLSVLAGRALIVHAGEDDLVTNSIGG